MVEGLSGGRVTMIEMVSLVIAAVAAGMINAIAGGGTLITFPVLLWFKTPEKVANATSTLALMVGTVGSLWGYRRHLQAVRGWLWKFVPVSVLGGLLGGVLLTHTDDRVFAGLVPYLILFATLIFLAQGVIRRFVGLSSNNYVSGWSLQQRPTAIWLAVLVQMVVAVYGGYFGAGIGILMLASLAFIGLTDIHKINSLKTILGALINFVASGWFIASGLVDLPRAVVMTLGAMIGYYLGSHFAQRIPQRHVRWLINGIGLTISAVMFYKQIGC